MSVFNIIKNSNLINIKKIFLQILESIEMFFHPKKSDMEASATSALSGPTNVESILDYFKSMDLKHFIEHSTKVLLFKLQVNDPTNKPVLLELDEISNICFKKSVVLLISTKFDETLFLYWKPKNVKQFWELKLDADMQNADKKKLVDFMIPLLAHIMKNGHTGKFLFIDFDEGSFINDELVLNAWKLENIHKNPKKIPQKIPKIIKISLKFGA